MLDGYIDYFYSSLPRLPYISMFDIQPTTGVPAWQFCWIIPWNWNRDSTREAYVYREHLQFLKISKLDNVGDLNLAIQDDQISTVIQVAEAYQSKQIAEIAEKITRGTRRG